MTLSEFIQKLKAVAFRPRRKPLRLRWPTDAHVVTQRFGARPEYYSRFGLQGHEGIDLRCPRDGRIYAAADGVVTMVMHEWRAGSGGRTSDHPYGVHVRIRHERSDGDWQTIYAHCRSAFVKVGDEVRAGQLIALGDSTGNSSGDHTHLTLKKLPDADGALTPPELHGYTVVESRWFISNGSMFVDPELYLDVSDIVV